jgi:nucleoid-associated protein YgaU
MPFCQARSTLRIAVAAAALAAAGSAVAQSSAPEARLAAEVQPPQFDTVDLDGSGHVVAAGTAEPGARVEVVDGSQVIATAVADASGAFALASAAPLPAGAHRLALRSTSPDGSVALLSDASASITIPDAAASPAAPPAAAVTPAPASTAPVEPAPATPVLPPARPASVTVQPGDTLWGIAAAVMGDATQWRVIYQANRRVIGNPAMIYPGQILAIPATRAGGGD